MTSPALLDPPAEAAPRPSWKRRGGLASATLVAAALVVAGGFTLGRATSPRPSTLAEAVSQASAGKLECGASSGIVTQLCTTSGTTGTTAATVTAAGTGGATALSTLLGSGAVSGTVDTIDGTTLTLSTASGSVTYTLPADAAVTETGAGALSDLAAGTTVYVAATTDSSGQATVTRIFLVAAGS